jgi:hypothetical protein
LEAPEACSHSAVSRLQLRRPWSECTRCTRNRQTQWPSVDNRAHVHDLEVLTRKFSVSIWGNDSAQREWRKEGRELKPRSGELRHCNAGAGAPLSSNTLGSGENMYKLQAEQRAVLAGSGERRGSSWSLLLSRERTLLVEGLSSLFPETYAQSNRIMGSPRCLPCFAKHSSSSESRGEGRQLLEPFLIPDAHTFCPGPVEPLRAPLSSNALGSVW